MVEARASSVKSAASGTAFIFIGRLADAIVGFMFSIVGARLMGKDLYGFVGATLGIVSIMALMGDMGVPYATTKFISQYLAKKRHSHIRAVIFNTFLLEALLGGLAAILCVGLAGPLANEVFHRPDIVNYIRFGAPLAFFEPVINGLTAIFQGYQRQEYYALSVSLTSMVRFGSSSVLLMINPTVESALLGYIIGAIVASVLFSVIVLVKILPGLGKVTAPKWPELKEMFGYSIPVVLTMASVQLFNWIGTLFLTAFGRAEEISWFNIAYGMVNMPVILSTSVGAAFFPIVADLHARGKHRLLSDSYARAVKFTSFVMIPVVLILMVVGQPFMYVLYGTDFMPAYEPFLILSLWGLIRPIAAISNAVSNGIGKPFLNTKANFICLALSFILCALLVPVNRPYPLDLIPVKGLMGAAWAVTIAFIVGLSLQIYYALGITKTRLPFDAWGKFLLASTLSAIVLALLLRIIMPFLNTGGILMSLLASVGLALLGLAIYLGIVKLMRVLDKGDVGLVEAMPLPMKSTVLRVFKVLAK
jgi:O-antigen/teichoic acid export membrane protein